MHKTEPVELASAPSVGVRLGPRPLVVTSILVVVLVLMGGAFGVGWMLRAPDETAFQNSLKAVTTTATVELHAPTAPTALGTVGTGSNISVPATASDGADTGQVTAAPLSAGAPAATGSVLFAVNERPVFALSLDGPHYRDLVFGDDGEDVQALNAALSDLGYAADPDETSYDSDTVESVAAFYDDRGYTALRTNSVSVTTTATAAATAAPTAGATAAAAVPTAMPRGSRMPFSEVFDLEQPDLTVLTAPGLYSSIGDGSAVMTLGRPLDHVHARVDALTAPNVSVGQAVAVADATSGTTADGTVESISDFRSAVTGEDGSISSPPGYDVSVLISEQTRAALTAGASVSLRFAIDDVQRIAVPASALRQDGTASFVLTSPARSTPNRVDVTVVAMADGWALLAEGSPLAVGDLVVVG
ncbi:hypothetical protein HQQ80_04090 [Microbacteriaceae bacterium VKM Ac-2855]|nr:hypothetical protein [Microbacteriaceae bacterium VKM Ac-2855]